MKYKEHDLIIVYIYVNDIIFGTTIESLCKEFENCMHKEFKMSMMVSWSSFSDYKSSKIKMTYS